MRTQGAGGTSSPRAVCMQVQFLATTLWELQVASPLPGPVNATAACMTDVRRQVAWGRTLRRRYIGRALLVENPLVDALFDFCLRPFLACDPSNRDCVLHAYGCDSVLENSCILIQGRSVEEVPEGVEVPETKGWGSGRMDVRAFKAKIEVLSPTSARTSIVANIDPNAPVPQSVVNFVVRAQFSSTNIASIGRSGRVFPPRTCNCMVMC